MVVKLSKQDLLRCYRRNRGFDFLQIIEFGLPKGFVFGIDLFQKCKTS